MEKLFMCWKGEMMSSITCSESILRKSACSSKPKTDILTHSLGDLCKSFPGVLIRNGTAESYLGISIFKPIG